MNVAGVSYPVDEDVQYALGQFSKLEPYLNASRKLSNLEIVRLLGSCHYPAVAELLCFIEKSAAFSNGVVKDLCAQTDLMAFDGRLRELFLHAHIRERVGEAVSAATAAKSTKLPDLVVQGDPTFAIEVYSPIDLHGYQLVHEHVWRILKYLEIPLGYQIAVFIGPISKPNPFYALTFASERIIRPWLSKFAEAASTWLLRSSPPREFRVDGPKGSDWAVSLTLEHLTPNFRDRAISQAGATLSSDARLLFEIGSVGDMAAGWWGRALRQKMALRQAGQPSPATVRALVVDFARLDTGFPDFLCWPQIAERIDLCVRAVADELGCQPYDVVVPARLGLSCCFGSATWIADAWRAAGNARLEAIGLARPCERQASQQIEWEQFMKGNLTAPDA